ncbi:MAG: serine/threonine protein kinase [Myxococcales bacterium]|nr:serine/threonine protein kinase [Myxococcales bacterium]
MRQAQTPLTVGDLVAGRYRVERTLGEGGMGVVYAVRDETSGMARAMKVVSDASDEEHVTRLLREGRAIATITSEHVVRVLDMGDVGGVPYVVMERLEGRTLRTALEAGPLAEQRVADLTIQACEGLAHAHANGIVHRDIKPSNLFVTETALGPQLKILDFGISRMTSLDDWERTATVTASNSLLGSPHYASPEQLQDPRSVDGRTDIWSLGVSMYFALCRRHPFDGRSLAEVLVAVMSRPPTPYAEHGASPSEAMRGAIARCLERSLERRFADVGELAAALAPLASPHVAALVPRIVEIARRPRAVASAAPPASNSVSERTLTVDVAIPPPARVPDIPGAAPSLLVSSADLAASASDAPPPRVSRRTGLALLASVAVVTVLVGSHFVRPVAPGADGAPVDEAPAAAVVPSPSSPASSEPAPSAEPAPSLVRLELIADRPITKIIKPISPRRVALEDGKAWVEVSPPTSDLDVEVELAGGGIARGVARVGGPPTLRLETASAAAPRARPPKRTPSRPASKSKPGELQDSPYGAAGAQRR